MHRGIRVPDSAVLRLSGDPCLIVTVHFGVHGRPPELHQLFRDGKMSATERPAVGGAGCEGDRQGMRTANRLSDVLYDRTR